MEPDRTFAPHVIPAGPGLELRPAIVADAAALYALIDRNRTHLSEWLVWATPDYLETGLRDFVAAREAENHSRKALTTTIWADGVLCGSIAMHQIDWLRSNASIGYWLDPGCQGRGVATQACRALVTEAFSVYGLHRVEIRCAAGNHRSAAIPQRLGFREEGILREAEALHGKFVDLRLFSMLAHEWPAPLTEPRPRGSGPGQNMTPDLIVLYEHPEWQKPLFAALERRGIRFAAYDLKQAAFDPESVPAARLYFNQASPSAYVRGNARAVPLAYALMRSLEIRGARVLNGSRAFGLELSKSAQVALMQQLGIPHPRSLAFNDIDTALTRWGNHWPALVKPEQGGSGARMYLLNSAAELPRLLRDRPDLWFPDNLLLLQEYFPVDPARGIVRMEFLGGELLYAMRVVSHGSFNLCPSEVCNPSDGEALCEVPATSQPVAPVEFFPYPEVPSAAVETGKRLFAAGGLDVGGLEYLEAADGRLIFYDVNANSNLRAPIASAFGFNPFDRVAEFLKEQIAATEPRP